MLLKLALTEEAPDEEPLRLCCCCRKDLASGAAEDVKDAAADSKAATDDAAVAAAVSDKKASRLARTFSRLLVLSNSLAAPARGLLLLRVGVPVISLAHATIPGPTQQQLGWNYAYCWQQQQQ